MSNSFSKILGVIAVLAYFTVASGHLVSAQDSAGPMINVMAADFTAKDLSGGTHTLSEYTEAGKFVMLEWFNPDCPYVVKYRAAGNTNNSDDEALAFANENDVVWLIVNSNAPGMQGSGSERNLKAIADYGIDVPVILDETGSIGMSYGASSTPQLFLINPEGKIVYNGGFDDTKTAADTPGVNYALQAMKQALAGKAVNPATTPHPGCSVKYVK